MNEILFVCVFKVNGIRNGVLIKSHKHAILCINLHRSNNQTSKQEGNECEENAITYIQQCKSKKEKP